MVYTGYLPKERCVRIDQDIDVLDKNRKHKLWWLGGL